ncbi:MAG: sugar phosphate isomerase/epimerase [Desulfotalea sp.]
MLFDAIFFDIFGRNLSKHNNGDANNMNQTLVYDNVLTLDQKMVCDEVTIAASIQWHAYPKKFEWLLENNFAMEYAPNPTDFSQTKQHLLPYVKLGVPVRHHAYFPKFEIGDPDPSKAELAMSLHFDAIDAMKGCGDQNMTVHVGLPPSIETDHERAVTNLSRLVEYGDKSGITICLENLRFGPTSNPEIILDWTKRSGAKITMDIGHAVSSKRVVSGELEVTQIINMFSHNLEEVHFYESETTRHHAPKDMTVLGPIVQELLKTPCRWWTIELDSYDEILRTRKLVDDFVVNEKRYATV